MHRSPLFNFVAGVMLATVVWVELFTHQAQAHAAEVGQSLDRLNQTLIVERAKTAELERHAQELAARAADCDANLRAATQPKPEDIFANWYTVLYESAPANSPAPGAAPLELLNLIRPGLGTVLAKLQPPAPSTAVEMRARWVFRGAVEPISGPQDGRIMRTSLTPEAVQ